MQFFIVVRWERNLTKVFYLILVAVKSLSPIWFTEKYAYKTYRATYSMYRKGNVCVCWGGFGHLASVLHSEMAPDLLKVRPTMNHRSLLTLEVSGVPYVLVRGDHIQTGCSRQWGHSHCPSVAVTFFVLFFQLPVTNFSRNYFSFVQVSFF